MDESKKWMKSLDESWTSMNFLDDNYKLTNNLDEPFDRLECMDGTNSKRMKYLEKRGTWMNLWMIIGSRWIVWMKLLVGWMYGWK